MQIQGAIVENQGEGAVSLQGLEHWESSGSIEFPILVLNEEEGEKKTKKNELDAPLYRICEMKCGLCSPNQVH